MDAPTAPAADARAVSLQLLDGFALQCHGSDVDLPLATQRLIAFLAVHDRPLLRTYVAGCLWPDKTSDRSFANLRSALWRLRRPAAAVVEGHGGAIRLSPGVVVDVRDALAAARAEVVGDARAEVLGAGTGSDATLLLRGDLLPDWYDDWLVPERERLRQLRLHALEALCARLAAAGRYGAAVDAGLAAVTLEPLRESAHHALIAAHLAEGNAGEAARQYVRYRDLVWDALEVEPSARLVSLVVSVVDVDVATRWATSA